MASLREQVRTGLGDDVDIVGWTYQLLPPDQLCFQAALEAVRGSVRDEATCGCCSSSAMIIWMLSRMPRRSMCLGKPPWVRCSPVRSPAVATAFQASGAAQHTPLGDPQTAVDGPIS